MSDEQTYFIIEETVKGKVLTSLPDRRVKNGNWRNFKRNSSGLFLEQAA